jgi:hypothetical protein
VCAFVRRLFAVLWPSVRIRAPLDARRILHSREHTLTVIFLPHFAGALKGLFAAFALACFLNEFDR